jgi:hypothetical protein
MLITEVIRELRRLREGAFAARMRQQRSTPFTKKLTVELLEDRRLLSIDSPFAESGALVSQGEAISAETQVDQGPAGDGPDSAWPMKFRDIYNTGRADFSIPAERLNDSFFDIFAWQKRTPNSPGEGNLTSTSMVFYDGAGPGGADIVAGGYQWPKGVQGMDRKHGRRREHRREHTGVLAGRHHDLCHERCQRNAAISRWFSANGLPDRDRPRRFLA